MNPFLTLVFFALFYTVAPTPNQTSETEMIYVEGGIVKIDGKKYQVKSILVDKHEVTMGEFNKFVKATAYLTTAEKTGGAKIWKNSQWTQAKYANWRHDLFGKPYPKDKYKTLPVSNISYTDAMAYATWAGKRIPTVAEWTFIAQGGNIGKKTRYSGSNTADEVAWYADNAYEIKQDVCKKMPNELGLCDVSGNVHEFVVDVNGDVYARGGCYFSNKDFCEIKDTGWKVQPNEVFHTFGFRCVKDYQ